MMKKFVAILSALMMMILAIVPVVSASADSTMYVNSANGLAVNLRDQPSKSGKVEVQLGVGFPVTVQDVGDGWCTVTAHVAGKDIHGYMSSEFLQYGDPAVQKQSFVNAVDRFVVTVRGTGNPGRVFLRAAGSRSSAELRAMSNGEKLTVVAYSHAWYKVLDAHGNLGYVAKAYVKK